MIAVGCGGEPKPEPAAPPPAPAPIETVDDTHTSPPSSADEARRVLASAAAATDARERCRLLSEAVLLDPTSVEARSKRAQSRCALAKDLLSDAKAAFGAKPDVGSAKLLLEVAMRAGLGNEAKPAIALLAKADPASKLLAARALSKLSDPAGAAAIYRAAAVERITSGATIDAVDAELDAAIADAHTPGGAARAKEGIATALDHAADTSNWGSTFIAAKLVDALAAVRNAGEDVEPLVKRVASLPLFASGDAKQALEIERAIASARAGKTKPLAAIADKSKTAAHLATKRGRAVLAVLARVENHCDVARAHARAHRFLDDRGLSFADDVAWADGCGSATAVTLVRPVADEQVEDAQTVAAIEPIAARARLVQLAKDRPNDVSLVLARLQVEPAMDRELLLLDALQRLPDEPWLRVEAMASAKTNDKPLRELVAKSVDAPLAPELYAAAIAKSEGDPVPLYEALVSTCAKSDRPRCLAEPTTLVRATSYLRAKSPKLLVGIDLPKEDAAAPAIRLDLVLAAVELAKQQRAEALASGFEGPEGALAHAAIAGLRQKCPAARDAMGKAKELETKYPDTFAKIRKTCP